jgi:two-component system, NtrC family, sensor histidine kinase HydH
VRILKNILIQPKSLILIFTVTAIVVILSAFIELNQSKSEMLELMEKQGHSILETVLVSSNNALVSYNKIEGEVKRRLLNNAQTIKLLEEKCLISNSLLERFAKDNNIYRINIFNSAVKKIYTSHKDVHNLKDEKENPNKYLAPIFNGEEDTLIIGIKPARFLDEQRFAVALATKDRKAIVLNVNADELLKFRKEVGFGVLLRKVTENPQIVYAALQDEKGIIAGSGKVEELESIKSSELIQNSLKENAYKWRVQKTQTLEVFEVLHPFIHDGKTIGIFRLGLSLEPLNKINDRLTRRILIIAFLLFVFGTVTITLIFVRQNFSLLSKRFTAIESYSSRIVDNVSDGIVVMDSYKRITLINKAAQSILDVTESEAKEKKFESVFPSTSCDEIWSSALKILEIECILNKSPKVFLLSLSEFEDENKLTNYILVFRDLTEQKQIERQIQRNEKMIAMGELASSVAHEIRNPLNSIGTIAQQLGKDFVVKENENEFRSLTQVVYSEVKRINETIESFLRFAKPQPINAEEFSLNSFFEELVAQYSSLSVQKNNSFSINSEYDGNVVLDKSQMKQVFINLIENSIDAMKEGGVISIRAFVENEKLKIIFSDNGIGVEPDRIGKIFDLYYTSKKKGNGIGLSIVHKIIIEHGGSISANSRLNEGTSFQIKLPVKYS